MPDLNDYPFEIRRLSEEEGGGFLISYSDFNSCMADGETVEEAIANGRAALGAVVATLKETGHPIPAPGSGGASGKFVQRLPKSLHTRLAERAKAEGVSMNTLVATMLAESLGVRDAHHR